MKIFRSSTLNNFITGLIGFLVGTFAGILTSYLIIRLNLLRPLINLIPEDQPLIRLLAGILVAFLGIGIGGAVNGLLRGYSLYTIDPQGSRRRYLLAGAFAYGISGGVLVIPFLLILSLLSLYNPGSGKDPATFLTIFTLFGAIYGLLSGLLLVLLTLRLRYIWLPWLASIVGTALGGTLLGVIVWRQDAFLQLPSRFLQSIVFLIILGVALVGLAGGLIALAYQWAAVRRERTPDAHIEPKRWQDILVIVAGVVIVLLMFTFVQQAVSFLTFHTGTTTTSLDLETQGVHWQTPAPVSPGSSLENGPSHGLSIGPEGALAAVWTLQADDQVVVAYAYSRAGENEAQTWSQPVVVSDSSGAISKHPQIVQGADGNVHIVWTSETGEGMEIRYSRCQGDSCSASTVLSGPGGTACDPAPEAGTNDWSAIGISDNGMLTAAWNAGGLLAYASWKAGDGPPQQPDACLEPLQSDQPAAQWQPRLAASGVDQPVMVYSTGEANQDATIGLVMLGTGGVETTTQIGQGSLAEVYADRSGMIHAAWCSADGAITSMAPDGAIEKIPFPPCLSRPGLFQDSIDRMHLVWYSDQVENNFADRSQKDLMYESIQTEDGWSEPAIVSTAAQAASLSTANAPDGTLYLAWQDTQENTPALVLARQNPYQCSPDNLTSLGRAVLDVVQTGGFHPSGYQSPFCGNNFEGFIYMPNPQPEFSSLPSSPNGGFDRMAATMQQTQYEVLLSNMQWDQDEGELSPGYRVVEGVATLYNRIKNDPASFPRGLTVRIVLGNFPEVSNLVWGDQIWNVIQDLREAGVDQMEDPAIGWKLEVANFAGTYPHSHTKFVVIDGQLLISAGYNISYFHLPGSHPSGRGDNLTDLGMLVSGPVAQESLAVFDDLWTGANQLVCTDLMLGDASDDWRQTCEWKVAQPSHMPETLKFLQTDQDQAAFALYRTDIYKEADEAYITALSNAEQSIDALHVNFSAEMICLVNIVAPGICTYANALPWMKAIVQSVEQNHTHVRVMMENANMNGLENRVGISIMLQELERNGVSEYVEFRFFNGRLHTKSALIDDKLLFVGSQNFHYSSFGQSGLLEFVTATESPDAINLYKEMYEYYWNLAVPYDQAVWGATGE